MADIILDEEQTNHTNISRTASLTSNRSRVKDWIGYSILIVFSLCAFFGETIAPYPPDEFYLPKRLSPPSISNMFGTDEFGRDILSRVIAGSRISFASATIILTVNAFIGSVLGMLAGMIGGPVDDILMRITEIFLSIPIMVLAIAITSILGPSINSAVAALSVVFWPYYARIIRSQILTIREQPYIQASVALGAGKVHLAIKHLFPAIWPLLITKITLDVGAVILMLGSLSFLGLGAQPPTPEWGALILSGRDYMKDYWWLVTFPGLSLTLVCLGFNLAGDSLQDYFIAHRSV